MGIEKQEEEVTSMVHSAMVGITELMTDDAFLCWMEEQDENILECLTTLEVYNKFRNTGSVSFLATH